MNNRFLISVAALSLLAGTGLANAQGTGMGGKEGGASMHGSPSAGGPASERSEKSGAMQNRESSPGMKSSQSEKSKSSTVGQAREETGPKKSMSSENGTKAGSKELKAEDRGGRKDMKAEGREGSKSNLNAQSREGQKSNMNAESREGQKSNLNAQGQQERNGSMNAQTKTGTERSQTTTGQAGASAKLSTEQRTQITSVIREQHVAPVTNVDFAISVGTRVPRERVHLLPLPGKVVTIYPQWRGYEFFLVRDEIVVVDPRTLEIVDVIPA